MQTKAKSNSVVTTAMSEDGQAIIFRVRDAGELQLRLDDLSQEVRDRAMIHGLVQRVADAAALSRDTATGKPATAVEKYDAMRELVEHYNAGAAEWRLPGRSGGGGDSLLLRALCVVKADKTPEQVRAWLKERTAKERAALSAMPAVAAEMDKLRAEAGKGVDADDLLSKL